MLNFASENIAPKVLLFNSASVLSIDNDCTKDSGYDEPSACCMARHDFTLLSSDLANRESEQVVLAKDYCNFMQLFSSAKEKLINNWLAQLRYNELDQLKSKQLQQILQNIISAALYNSPIKLLQLWRIIHLANGLVEFDFVLDLLKLFTREDSAHHWQIIGFLSLSMEKTEDFLFTTSSVQQKLMNILAAAHIDQTRFRSIVDLYYALYIFKNNLAKKVELNLTEQCFGQIINRVSELALEYFMRYPQYEFNFYGLSHVLSEFFVLEMNLMNDLDFTYVGIDNQLQQKIALLEQYFYYFYFQPEFIEWVILAESKNSDHLFKQTIQINYWQMQDLKNIFYDYVALKNILLIHQANQSGHLSDFTENNSKVASNKISLDAIDAIDQLGQPKSKL